MGGPHSDSCRHRNMLTLTRAFARRRNTQNAHAFALRSAWAKFYEWRGDVGQKNKEIIQKYIADLLQEVTRKSYMCKQRYNSDGTLKDNARVQKTAVLPQRIVRRRSNWELSATLGIFRKSTPNCCTTVRLNNISICWTSGAQYLCAGRLFKYEYKQWLDAELFYMFL